MFARTFDLGRAAVAIALAAGAARAQGIQYTLTDASGSQSLSAIGEVGLSENGYVVNWAHVAGDPTATFGYRWSPAGVVVPSSPAGVAWGSFDARAVNDDGTFVGIFGTSGAFMSRGYRWRAGLTEELFSPSGNAAQPHAINNAGWMVGMATSWAAGTDAGVLWDPSLNATTIVGIDDAADINELGQIAGAHIDLQHNNAYIAYLSDHGTLTPLGNLDPLNKGSVVPQAIEAHARIVGVNVVGQHDHAFIWSAATGIKELPGLGINQFPHNIGALDINDLGWAVGYAPGLTGQTNVIWAPDGSVKELDPLVQDLGPGAPWQLLTALHINAVGQIAATAWNPQLGQSRAVLLTPANLHASALVPQTAGVVNSLTVSGATSGKLVMLVGGPEDPLDRGYTPIPGCEPLGLAMSSARVVATALADATGSATFQWSVPNTLAGKSLRLQAFQRASCALSTIVHVTF